MSNDEKALYKSQAHEVVLEEFECPICMNYMIPPIKSCNAGHNFCYICDKKVLMCPLCRGDKNPARNLGMEKVFDKLVVPCLNNLRGCTVEVLGADLKMHQRYCPFRMLLCPLRVLNNCRGKGQLKDLADHCLVRHQSNIFQTHTMKLIWPRFRYTTVLRKNEPGDSYHVVCQAYGELFKCIWDMDMDTGFMRWCVVYMGPLSNIERYSFEICFENVENPVCGEEPIRFRSCCHPDHQVLFQKGKYLLTHADMMRKLCGLRGLYYTITILEDGVIPVEDKVEEEQMRSYFVSPEASKFFDLNDPSLVEVRMLFRRLNLNDAEERFDESF